LRVIVTDNGSPPLSATQLVTIVVNEVNLAPVLNPLASLTNNEGAVFTFTAELPPTPISPRNILSFSLISAPGGASINPANGVFSWTATEAQGPSTNTFGVKVTDNGVPPLSATQTMTIVVNEVNVAPVLNPIPIRLTMNRR